MAPGIRSGDDFHMKIDASKKNGFTLLELMIVITILGILYAIVVPLGGGLVKRSREAALKKDLYIFRESIDKFFADNKRYPRTLQELVTSKYIRAIPVDPFTNSSESWITVSSDNADGGIFDVKSSSSEVGRDGTPVSSW
jgi:general secretion pathway protein G